MTRSRSRAEVVSSVAAVLLSAVVVVTCSASREAAGPARGAEESVSSPPRPSPEIPERGAASVASVAPAASAASVASAASSAPLSGLPGEGRGGEAEGRGGEDVPLRSGLALPRFNGALGSLASGRRKDHVRVLWLGDSHTAADLWSGAVRRALQKRFGDGGPGFVHVGWGSPRYRHEAARIDAHGKWLVEPARYAQASRFDDGVFGLGGVRLIPNEPDCTAMVEVPGQKEGALAWDLAYRLPDGASLRVEPSGGKAIELKTARGKPDEIQHAGVKTRDAHRVRVTIQGGRPQFMGVVVEAEKPGVVLDTLGLNGARVATFLAWERPAWVAEVARRKPDLVVLAFGTNETSDPSPEAEKYERHVVELMKRVREAAPETDCLVITPIDRAGNEFRSRLEVISRGMEQAAAKMGCATWSGQKAMGGPGSMATWAAESPARGGSDGIHLTPKGYASLASELTKELLPR